MNYLGHLYFSGNNIPLMQANLYGDFIKGSHMELLPEDLRQGVVLHRSIDHFIDHHESVRSVLPLLRIELPKVASIAIDIYFDHLLAKNWAQFHPQQLNDYLQVVYNGLNPNDTRYNQEYRTFLQKLMHYNWIAHYPTLDAIERMSVNISKQLSFPNKLVDGKKVFVKHENVITNAFYVYMQAANEHFLTEELRILS